MKAQRGAKQRELQRGGAFGISGVLADPQLQVMQAGAVIAQNDHWSNDALVAAVSAAVGAFPLGAGSTDSALVITLSPGLYSLVVTGAGGTAGLALVEAYEAP